MKMVEVKSHGSNSRPKIEGVKKIYYPETVGARFRLFRFFRNLYFYLSHIRHCHKTKIFYALTPPPWIRNSGDQAQVLAIRAWLTKHFGKTVVIELDQEKTSDLKMALQWLLDDADLIFLHSGGNLGDRYMSTEGARRRLLRDFPNNRIISLPQTIYFTGTEHGNIEREKCRVIYNAHRHLTVLCRDIQSARIAEKLFTDIKIITMPDFVLSLPSGASALRNGPILVCLRNDIESALSEDQKRLLLSRLPDGYMVMDTRREKKISPKQRAFVVGTTLRQFEGAGLVITDRFHGLIFAMICRRPCIALSTVGHKLTSGISWFKNVPWVRLASQIDEVPELIRELENFGECHIPEWVAAYFDRLPILLGLAKRNSWLVEEELWDGQTEQGSWICHPKYQDLRDIKICQNLLHFHKQTSSADDWCYVYVDPIRHPWTDVAWTMTVKRISEFREFAFNFRYQSFEDRYRYRFEANQIFFDRRVAGQWDNNLGSVPFRLQAGRSYSVRIEALGPDFRIYVDDQFQMQNYDGTLTWGSICIILWETDMQTPLLAEVKDQKVFSLGI